MSLEHAQAASDEHDDAACTEYVMYGSGGFVPDDPDDLAYERGLATGELAEVVDVDDANV